MTTIGNVVVVIPAYRPAEVLTRSVQELAQRPFGLIVVIDDGSGPEYQGVFTDVRSVPNVVVLRHAANLGKGAALKTGMNYVLCELPDVVGIVTADADGQHRVDDIQRVAARLVENPERVVLGVRRFDSPDVPLRSRFGNNLSIVAVRCMVGQKLSDTQTGLRGLPTSLLPHLLRIKSSGYEFELDTLIATKHHGYRVVEEPIAAVYEDGNASSHFNPLLDSVRIYFVLLRFGFVSLLTSLLDNIVFLAAFTAFGSIGRAQLLGRLLAIVFNYTAARKAVFLSREKHTFTLPRYLLLVLVSGLISYGLIQLLQERTGLSVIASKMIAEALLFFANFAIQRDFIFQKVRGEANTTDWDRYYHEVPAAARITRKYTENVIVSALRRHCRTTNDHLVLVELGGANSWFLDRIRREFCPREYHVIDTNQHGLNLLERRLGESGSEVVLHNEDCLALRTTLQADIALSVGLIEHFALADVRRVIRAHFDLLKPGGWVLITFPTPTWLYRLVRSTLTALGMWRFPDERPLRRAEVISAVQDSGIVRFETLLWRLGLTQYLILAQKK